MDQPRVNIVEVPVTVIAEDHGTADLHPFDGCCGIAWTRATKFGNEEQLKGCLDEDQDEDDYYDEDGEYPPENSCAGLILSRCSNEGEINLAKHKGYRHLFADVWGLWDSDWTPPEPYKPVPREPEDKPLKTLGLYKGVVYDYEIIVNFPYVGRRMPYVNSRDRVRGVPVIAQYPDVTGSTRKFMDDNIKGRYVLVDLATQQHDIAEAELLGMGFQLLCRFTNPKHAGTQNSLFLYDAKAQNDG